MSDSPICEQAHDTLVPAQFFLTVLEQIHEHDYRVMPVSYAVCGMHLMGVLRYLTANYAYVMVHDGSPRGAGRTG